MNSAYRLWANDTLLIENGMIGRSKSEEKPIQSFQRAALQNDGQPISLLLQILSIEMKPKYSAPCVMYLLSGP